MLDLLHCAARSLVLKGRLVYLIPTTYDFTENDLPRHPCLAIESICEQTLSSRHGRRCVTMVKERCYSHDLETQFLEYKHIVLTGNDDGFGKLKSKLELALSREGIDNASVKQMLSNSALRRRNTRKKKLELKANFDNTKVDSNAEQYPDSISNTDESKIII